MKLHYFSVHFFSLIPPRANPFSSSSRFVSTGIFFISITWEPRKDRQEEKNKNLKTLKLQRKWK